MDEKHTSDVYKYQEATEPQKLRPIRVTPYATQIEKHMAHVFPNRKKQVFPEKISEFVQVDIHLLEAPTNKDVQVLYTVGMSALSMTLPKEYLPQFEGLQRAELMMFLPAEWKLIPPAEGEDENNSIWWPVNLMKYVAKFPHEFQSWLGWGHVLANSAKFEAYDASTELCGTMLGALQEEVSVFKAEDGTQINMYALTPLYKEEMLYKEKEGIEALFGKLNQVNGYGMIVFPDRPNVAEGEN